MSMKLLLLFYQIRYSRENNRPRFSILEMQNNNLTNRTHDWLRLCGFSNYAKIRVSSRNILTLHSVTTIWLIFSSENLHALDLNTLEQRIPRHVVLWNLQLCVTSITFSLFSVIFFLHAYRKPQACFTLATQAQSQSQHKKNLVWSEENIIASVRKRKILFFLCLSCACDCASVRNLLVWSDKT